VTVSTGIISTIAGSGTYRIFYVYGAKYTDYDPNIGYSGDNGNATRAALNYPSAVAVDSAGIPHNLYF
jgi:hypothetical protein